MKNKTTEIDYDKLSIQAGLSLNEMTAMKKSSAMRTTFRLTDHSIESLNELSNEIKMKDFLDEIGDLLNQQKWFTEVIVEQAKEMNKNDLKNSEKKSFALSKKTVRIFNDLSNKNFLDRDLFVNQSIIIYYNLLKKLKDEDARKVKLAQIKIIEFWGKSENFQKELFELLGDDHQVAKEFGHVNKMIMNLDLAIDEYLESGKPIELF